MKELIASIKNNADGYRPLPFWSWNDKLDKESLLAQIDWMQRNGIGGFFMHARSGLLTDYLSEEWMESIEACAEYADKLNMEAWIYDENGWPSGFAGGRLIEKEENCDCYLEKSIGEFDEKATVSYLITNDSLIRCNRAESAGEYLNVYIRRSISTADILNKDVVDEFIDITHQSYKKRFGEDFSKKVKGFFTDEPQYQRNKTAFTTQMYNFFKLNYGEDILDGLGLLFIPKNGYRVFRYRYWKSMQRLMLDNFTKNIYNWCEENGVGFTGHYLCEENLFGQMLSCAGVMPHYAYMSMPGIDWLGSNNVSIIATRQLASVAAQFSKKRTITESFACCGWQASPKTLKRIYDSQCFAGVGTLCTHLIPYAEYGQRSKDHPAHYSDINPWVKYEFKDFNDYSSRISYLISESDELVNVAVLHPIRSAYSKFNREDESSLKEMDIKLTNDCFMLTKNGICFHFLDETLLKEYGFVEDGKICCKDCRYDFLVLPHISDMDDSTEILIKKYLCENGKILVLGENPEFKEGEPHDYSYIISNCDLNDIIKAQPFTVLSKETELFYQYRVISGMPFITVFNSSNSCKVKNTFAFNEKSIKSFIRLDLLTLKQEILPLEITLEPGQAMILFPSEQICEKQCDLKEYKFKLNNADVEFQNNFLTIDHVRYSEDGINYSELLPISGVFAMLLEKRYKGKIYFKYQFEVKTIPNNLFIAAEAKNDSTNRINGNEFKFDGQYEHEKHLKTANISQYIHKGINEYITCVDWYQSEEVYYALFGENVTEGLKNCIVYNSELENIYLFGKFGVYTDKPFTVGNPTEYVRSGEFYIDKVTDTVKQEPIFEGYPFFAGRFKLTQSVCFDSKNILFELGGSWSVAYITVNGDFAGKLLFERKIDISRFTRLGENTIEIELIISNYNLLGPHHAKGRVGNSGVSPWTFDLTDTWNDCKSDMYDDDYCLLKFDIQ